MSGQFLILIISTVYAETKKTIKVITAHHIQDTPRTLIIDFL